MAERLVAELTGKIPAGGAEAIGAVERAPFIPTRIWVYDEGSELRAIDRDIEPGRWWQVVETIPPAQPRNHPWC